MWPWRQTEALQLQTKECQGSPQQHWKLGRPKEGLCPTAFRGSIASSFQKCEAMHFCCFCGLLLRQPWKTNMWLKGREVAEALRQTGKGALDPWGPPSALFLFLTADHHFLLFGQHSPWSFPLPSYAGLGHQAVQGGPFSPYYQELTYDRFKPNGEHPLSFMGIGLREDVWLGFGPGHLRIWKPAAASGKDFPPGWKKNGIY